MRVNIDSTLPGGRRNETIASCPSTVVVGSTSILCDRRHAVTAWLIPTPKRVASAELLRAKRASTVRLSRSSASTTICTDPASESAERPRHLIKPNLVQHQREHRIAG